MQSATPWQDEAQRMVTLETDGYAYTVEIYGYSLRTFIHPSQANATP